MFVAVDVGGTKVCGALFDASGLHARLEEPTPVSDGRADPGGKTTLGVLRALLDAAGGPPEGIGLGVCEYVTGGRAVSREVLGWPSDDDWPRAELGGRQITVESDVRCGARAELELGALLETGSGFFVSWGTGLSGCLVLNRTVVEGAHGRAIALGEVPVDGTRLESVASGAAVARRYAELSGVQVVGAREVIERAAGGDATARVVVSSAGTALADALATVIRVIDPGVVVLGGGLGSAGTCLVEALRTRLAVHHEAGLPPVSLLQSVVGSDGPLVGAALAAGWRPQP